MEKKVVIQDNYITLGQFLKTTAIISSGGMAKPYLATYPVKLNDELEDRRGKKIYPGDRVEVEGEGTFLIVSSKEEHTEESPH